MEQMTNLVYFGDNLEILKQILDGAVRLIYIDPPFNSGKLQTRTQIRTVPDPEGDRFGLKGTTYKTKGDRTLGSTLRFKPGGTVG